LGPLSLLGLRLGCRRYGKLQSFFSDAIAPHSFLRKVPLTVIVSSSARSRTRADADVSGANSSPQGPLHTQRRAGWLPPSLTKAAASKDRLELAPTGGISSCRKATPIEQPGRSVAPLFSSLFCPVPQPLRGGYNTADLGGGWGSAAKQPERRPRGQHRMGRHEAALCHSGLAPKRQIASPALLPSAREPTPYALSCFSLAFAPASARARHSA